MTTVARTSINRILSTDPQEARVAVPDERFDWLCSEYRPKSKIPAYLSVIDIAGLVKGAASGEGLGNAFLANIRAVDGILHVVRAFDDDNIVHVEDSVNPIRDMEIIHHELRLKDEEFLQNTYAALKKHTEKLPKHAISLHAQKFKDLFVVEKLLNHVGDEFKDVRIGDWTNDEIDVINTLQLLSAKPVIYAVNVSLQDYIAKKNKWIPKIREWIADNSEGTTIVFNATLETELANTNDAERSQRCQALKTASALPEIIVNGYRSLNLMNFFTAGPEIVRAWTIRNQSRGPQAASVIHTDFEKGFIAVDVMKFADLHKYGSEEKLKRAGKLQTKGKEYILEDGDVVFFKINKARRNRK